MNRRRILLVVAVLVAALGAGLVFLYAQDAEDRAADDVQLVDVVRATGTIPAGMSAEEANRNNLVEIASVPATEALDGSTGEGEAFKGSVAKTTIYQGEQLLTQKFGTIEEIESDAQLPIPAGLVGYPLVLDDQQRISGYTQPGSRVGAIITGMFDGTNVESRLLLDEVNIFATGAETITPVTQPDADDPNAVPTAVAPVNQYIIAIEPRDTLRLSVAQEFGKIQLILLPPDSTLKVGDPVTAADIFGEGQ